MSGLDENDRAVARVGSVVIYRCAQDAIDDGACPECLKRGLVVDLIPEHKHS